ncbi:MAG: histidine kinase dimerization/phospho-acceptor domain-containing protein, partial [Rhodospirillales bacterium]
EQIEGVTGAADIFLYDVGGTVIAGRPASDGPPVIAENLAGVPFFTAALQGRLGRFFTVDAVTGVPVYAYSHAVRSRGIVRGVVVVVIDLGRAQDKFKLLSAEHEIIVTDREQVIFLSSNPAWRLQSLKPLTIADRRAIERDGRYAVLSVARSSIDMNALEGDLLKLSGDGAAGGAGAEFLWLERPLTKAEWQVAILVDTSLTRRQSALAGFAALIAVGCLILLITAVYQRRRRIHDRLAFQTDANVRLEERVHERTAELSEINRQLQASVVERQKAEDNLRLAQEELIQASKLAALGQMSAGLSHELNQPLAAIRSYADNARTYLDRGQADKALNNLSGIG